MNSIANINELLKYIPEDKKTLVTLDFDETLMTSTSGLGNATWVEQLIKKSCEFNKDNQEAAVHAALGIFYDVMNYVDMKPVEEEFVSVIDTLREQEVSVLGLTARGERIIANTHRHLSDIGVDFSRDWQNMTPMEVAIPSADVNWPVKFEGGIVFCNGKNKGICHKAFLTKVRADFEYSIHVDDTLKHVESVCHADNSISGYEITGLVYTYRHEALKRDVLAETMPMLTALMPRLTVQSQAGLRKMGIFADQREPICLQESSVVLEMR